MDHNAFYVYLAWIVSGSVWSGLYLHGWLMRRRARLGDDRTICAQAPESRELDRASARSVLSSSFGNEGVERGR